MKSNLLVATATFGALILFSAVPSVAQSNGCNIKGNVSTKGERIYHVPGQKYYNDTVIQASHGERWFCSEAEARAAGWRKSKVSAGCGSANEGLKCRAMTSHADAQNENKKKPMDKWEITTIALVCILSFALLISPVFMAYEKSNANWCRGGGGGVPVACE